MHPSTPDAADNRLETDLTADIRWLGKIASGIIQDPHLADDACQEAWLASGHSNPSRGELVLRLRRYIHRRWRGERRRRDRERRAAQPEALPSTELLLARQEQRQRIWAELQGLDEPFRTTLLLRFQEDLATDVLAEHLGVSQSTVTWRIRRGLALLRKRLADDEGRGGLNALIAALPLPTIGAKEQVSSAGGLLAICSTIVVPLIVMKKTILAFYLLGAISAIYLTQEGTQPLMAETAEASFSSDVLLRGGGTSSVPEPSELNGRSEEPRRQAVQLELPEHENEETLPAPLVRLHLSTDGRRPVPETVSIALVGVDAGNLVPIFNKPVQFEAGELPVDIPLHAHFNSLLMLGVTNGYVQVTADGFGTQNTEEATFQVAPGSVTDVSLKLTSADVVNVLLVDEQTGLPLDDATIGVVGPSAKLKRGYKTTGGKPIGLQLAPQSGLPDHIHVHNTNGGAGTWSTSEVLQLPLYRDGLRHLPIPSGCTLIGTITMASGLPVPADTEIRYFLKQVEVPKSAPRPVWMNPRGDLELDELGRFESGPLPTGLLHLCVQSKRADHYATPLSPEYVVDITEPGVKEVQFVIPDAAQVLKLDLAWGDRKAAVPGGGSLALFVELYRAAGEDDKPYGPMAGERELLIGRDYVASGKVTPFSFPPGTLTPDTPLILCVGRNPARKIERRLIVEGNQPFLIHDFASDVVEELLPLAKDVSSQTTEANERRRAARSAVADVTLYAKTPEE